MDVCATFLMIFFCFSIKPMNIYLLCLQITEASRFVHGSFLPCASYDIDYGICKSALSLWARYIFLQGIWGLEMSRNAIWECVKTPLLWKISVPGPLTRRSGKNPSLCALELRECLFCLVRCRANFLSIFHHASVYPTVQECTYSAWLHRLFLLMQSLQI